MNRRTSILKRIRKPAGHGTSRTRAREPGNRRERRERIAEIAIFLGSFLLALVITYGLAVRAEGVPLSAAERAAIARVESGGDPLAHKKDEDARGILQIRAIYVADANRILGEERFTHQDAFDPAKAWEMFQVVTDCYIRACGYPDTFETRARIHNGGPRGPRRKNTLGYWRKVNAKFGTRGGAAEARPAHTRKDAGSSPAPATNNKEAKR